MKKIEGMLGMNTGSLSALLIDIGIRIAITLAILIIGFWIAKVLSKAVVKVLIKRDTDESLVSFLRSLTSIGLKVLVLITAMSQLGVEMTSFVAILGAAGLAIGLAFSGTLSNFAGGVMILLFKPFKVGDYVNMQGEEGTVKEILIFNTILTTLDNKIIILANGAVANGTITNFTKAEKRRVDWVFGIAYGDDLKVAKVLLDKFISEDERILKEGANFIGVGELGDSSVNITVRAWVKTEDYWNVFFAMNERVYNEFGEAGLSIPFPQMDVHMQKEG
ncbi:MAG: small conductance mechanosensitive channel [Crocinitomicaceae bacterium]|jgi:small conductance mechanosensitive channel